jgi:hypothetical protein
MCHKEPSCGTPRRVDARRAGPQYGVGTGFSHTVEFSRNVAEALRRLARGSRLGARHQSGGDASTGLSSSSNLGQPWYPCGVPGASQTLQTEAPPRALPPGVGTATASRGTWSRVASGDLLSSVVNVVPTPVLRFDDGLTLRTGVGHEQLPFSGRKVAPPSKSCQPSKIPGTKAWQPFERRPHRRRRRRPTPASGPGRRLARPPRRRRRGQRR